jgi:modification methylase
MYTGHRIIFATATRMEALADESVGLVVTSPPYPMIQMWDECFCRQEAAIVDMLTKGDGRGAWEAMHRLLDPVWEEVHRVLVPGGFACINIGDATRTLDGHFELFANHSRILSKALALGFTSLPLILWRKQTNAPNKFMGSGMLPAGAYVTLEHEYVLVLRKGNKRIFANTESKQLRQRSAFFWEERNQWFSDVWLDIKGSRQSLGDPRMRARSGAYPLELPLRLIHMYSLQGDTVLDPFMGTGTTMQAAIASGRNSVGYELESAMKALLMPDPRAVCDLANDLIDRRLANHLAFVKDRQEAGKPIKHTNVYYGFPVITRQEMNLSFPRPKEIVPTGKQAWRVAYSTQPASEVAGESLATPLANDRAMSSPSRPRQRKLFG